VRRRRRALDLIIANGEVIDGSGGPPIRADVGVAGDRIAAIAPHLEAGARIRIDAAGRVVAPGFIDLHSHSDLCLTLPLARQARLLEGRVRQGITTEVMGNCGIGCAPLGGANGAELRRICGFITPDGVDWSWGSIGSYLERVDSNGVLLNVATLVAHGAARARVIGARAGRPAPDEQAAIDAQVRAAVEEGAYGVSFGLIYPPGQFADTDELVSVARAAAAESGFAAFHQRGSSLETLEPAVREIIDVGRRSGAPVHHSHVETVGPRAWPGTEQVLRMHEAARRSGLDLSGDVIPYTAVCTTMLALYPPWSLDGGVSGFLERLREPGTRRRMKEEMAEAAPRWPPWEEAGRWTMNIARECGWDRIRLAHVDGAANKRYEQMTIAGIGRARGRDPFDALSDLLLEESGVATQLIFGISGDDRQDRDLVPLLQCPDLAFVTDAWEIGKGFPHPGAYGAFPRVLGHYVRERKLLALEEAIRRMTALPAARLGLADRGMVREGFRADLLVIDAGRVGARSSFGEPRLPAVGIDEVLINGVRVVEAGRFVPAPAGRVLRRGA
jgi:N-acyl-D-amino-acid deacylase